LKSSKEISHLNWIMSGEYIHRKDDRPAGERWKAIIEIEGFVIAQAVSNVFIAHLDCGEWWYTGHCNTTCRCGTAVPSRINTMANLIDM